MTIVPYVLGLDPASLPAYSDIGYLPASGTFFSVGNRIYVVKAIVSRDDTAPPPGQPNTIGVNVPVLVGIKFRHPDDQYWDRVWLFDVIDGSDVNTSRIVHVVRVYNTGDLDFGVSAGNSDNAPDPTQSIDVERVDEFSPFDPIAQINEGPGRGWKSRMAIDSVTGEGTQDTPANFGPPNGTHAQTHVARWFQTDDAGNIAGPTPFVDLEYIDQARIRDFFLKKSAISLTGFGSGQWWDSLYTLKNNWTNPTFNEDGTPAPMNPVPASQLSS
jgi:hypothetical protein